MPQPIDMDQEISIDDAGVVSGLEAPQSAADPGEKEWDDAKPEGDAFPKPASDDKPDSKEGGDDKPTGDADDDAGWEDDKPTGDAKPDPDDVPPEDRDPKGKVPSWRVREIRAQKDAEIQRLQAELDAARTGKPAASAQPAAKPASPEDAAIQEITATDLVIQDFDAKLQAVRHLVENAPEELPNYFRNADHMALEVAQWTAARQARIDGALARRESDAKQATEQKAREQQQTVQKIVNDYESAIKSSKIPECGKYAQRLASNAAKLNVGIREMVLTADEPDVLTATIGSNRKLFDELAQIDPAKPMTAAQLAKVAIRLGKAVAAYQAPKQSVVDDAEPAPERSVQPTATRRASRAGTHVPRYRVENDGTIVM